MRILIIGGGIGGLTLAAGLRRRGRAVTVVERDTDLSSTGGYHLHLNGTALDALADTLEPADLERLYAAAAAGRRQGPDIVRDMRGRLLAESRTRDEADSVNIDRITLRLILADAVGDDLVTGQRFTGFDRRPDGTIEARFAGGETRVAEVLVGADGIGSRIATELAGGPTSAPVGLVGIGGRTDAGDLPDDVAELLAGRSGLAVGPRGTALYIGYHDPAGHAAVRDCSEVTNQPRRPAYIWGAILPDTGPVKTLRDLKAAELRDATLAILRGRRWSERMLAVVRASEPDGVAVFGFHAASPDPARLAPWPAGTVTALGDAVHAMPPTAGMGAATAIQDAGALLTELDAVAAGRKTTAVAVHDFEIGMRERGARAIQASLRPIGWIRGTDTAVGSFVARVALPMTAAAASLTRRRSR